MSTTFQFVVFNLDEQKYALPLSSVRRIIRVVQILPIPQSDPSIPGVINLHGQMIPVFDIRRWFNLPARKLDLSDRLILVETDDWTIALLVDAVHGVIQPSLISIMRAKKSLLDLSYLSGVLEHDNEAIYLCDPGAFPAFENLSLPEGILHDTPAIDDDAQ